jgi:lysyl-tRNA synthetase class 2
VTQPTSSAAVPPAVPDLSEQEQVRHEKRERLLAAGSAAYPIAVPRTHSAAEVHGTWGHLVAGEETAEVVSVTGRVVFVRNTGKLCFATLQDGFTAADSGERLQVMLSLAEVGEQSLAEWKAQVDLGDFVSVTGRVISSRRGELSVLGTSWVLASKALRPLPTLHKELGEETRVRQRYADLVVRPEARDMVRTRAAVTRSIRETLHAEGYLELETPVLQLVHGGAAARPFRTHLNAFDIDMTLRIALELFLKRAMVGGADRVYELGRIFRNEGIDSSHSAEFTMLEAYQAWGDQLSTSTASGSGSRSTRRSRPRWATRSRPPRTPPYCAATPRPAGSSTTRPGVPRSSLWNCSARSSSRPCCSRRSCATTRRSRSRWPARTAATPT